MLIFDLKKKKKFLRTQTRVFSAHVSLPQMTLLAHFNVKNVKQMWTTGKGKSILFLFFLKEKKRRNTSLKSCSSSFSP